MKLQISLVLFLQVAQFKCLPDISGFLGDNVTLPSGVGPSGNFSSIEWSIFLNITWIATYRNNKENLDRVPRYKGRLGLNISTGDLTIHNLTSEDALEYTVDLTGTNTGQRRKNKVTVGVKKRLQKPSVEVFESESTRCHWSVRCQSTDKGVHLSWEAPPPTVTSSYNLTDADGLSVALLDLNDSTQHPVEVTCVSQRGEEKTSGSVSVTCRGNELKPTLPMTTLTAGRTRYVTVFFVGVLLTVFLWLCSCCRETSSK
ncbi:uncharacterized protein si:cabz01074946.1 [Pungitius pungitius]|uniref:uncharacterized protein si:cabz01074946.1 n=1 Tax=Pungitius pungitius TaxID=134920 RepID=UPI002E0EE2C1